MSPAPCRPGPPAPSGRVVVWRPLDYRLTRPEKRGKRQPARGRARPVAPEAAVPETAEAAEGAVGGGAVEACVLLPQPPEGSPVRRPVLRVLRARVPAVLDRDSVHLPALPAVR